jgi:hypothetical protein
MAAVDLQTLASGFLRQARLQTVPASTWLHQLNAKAVTALAAGDAFVIATGFEGGSSSIERRFDAQQLLQVTEICLRTLEAEASSGGVADGTNLHADFSERRSVWG